MASDRGQLPVWDTGVKAYWHLAQHVRIYLGQFGLLFGALLAVRYALGAISAMGGGGSRWVAGAIEGLLVLLALLAIVSICVGCHRAILLDRTPRLFDLFRFGIRELRYIGVWMATFAALVVPVVAVAQLVMSPGGSHWPILVIALAWSGFIGPAFALAFPVAAVDQPQPLRTGLRLGRGHRPQLLGVLIVVHLPLMAMALPLGLFGSALGDTAMRIAQTLLQLTSNLAMVAATSVAYQAIAERDSSDIAGVFD